MAVFEAARVDSAPSSCILYTVSNATDYWVSVGGCSPCLAAGCSFSLSSLACGDPISAPDDTVLQGPTSLCPSRPTCEEYLGCGDCLNHAPDCAWCGREGVCALSSSVHMGGLNCSAVQYASPCMSPQQQLTNVVEGNLVVRADPVLGGGPPPGMAATRGCGPGPGQSGPIGPRRPLSRCPEPAP